MTHWEQAQNTLAFSCSFACSASVLFDVWTNHQHFSRWWPNEHAQMRVYESAVAPHGKVLFQQVAPEGYDVWEIMTYQRVYVPHEITYIKSFSSPEGEAIVLPWMSSFPMEVWYKVTFEEGEGETVMTIEEAPYRATEAENQAFWFLREAIMTVLRSKMERLEQYLVTIDP